MVNFATNLLADGGVNVYHEFARLDSMTQWWHWALLLAICAAAISYIVYVYRRDSLELPRGLRWVLLALRITAFAGILFYFFDLEKRSERKLVKNSRALLLVDTSLSMGIQDADPTSGPGGRRRIDGVIDELSQGSLVNQLRRDHDVVVYRFDQGDRPQQVASYPRVPREVRDDAEDDIQQRQRALRSARITATVGGVFLGIALLAFVAYFVLGWTPAEQEGSWALLVAVVALIFAAAILSVANLRFPEIDFLATLGLRDLASATRGESLASTGEDNPPGETAVKVPWDEQLAPSGSETRLGDAIRYLVDKERGGPIAGIVVLTDGGSNAGIDCSEAMLAATDAAIPIYPVGLGSDERPTNVSVVDVEAPPRVYPGDSFSLTGYVQAFGLPGRTVKVELSSAPPVNGTEAAAEIEEERRVTLGDDGEILPIRFEVLPSQLGRRSYRLRLVPPESDHDARDNARSATVEIVERKNRVMLMAGGPTREFRFLRNLLYRDRDTTLDVYLQTGQPGMSQEADELLFQFPSEPDAMFEYDAIVAFDPDWRALDELQLELLERWVAEQAGGLIVAAGPVHTPQWASRTRGQSGIEIIKGLYPVIFYSRGSATLSLGRFASETAWPLQFARDGLDAEFLWLEDDALLSEEAWASFDGVYGYFAVKDPKPGARVYARFSDPNTSLDGELPIYLAGHFYGAGRVFFQASGEMWRLRAVEEAYFERYYTKLIRWVSQGRLLRDSTHGVLLVDKQRCLLGDHVAVRAVLMDAQHRPLSADEVTATLVLPDGRRSALRLRRARDAAREGMFLGQFTASLQGDYRIELKPPHADESETLTKEVRSRIPALETERPQRNDALLKDMADKTAGEYFVGLDVALNRGGAGRPPVTNLLSSQDQVTYLPGTPDPTFDRILMTWLMGFICGALCLEWLTRRLAKLA